MKGKRRMISGLIDFFHFRFKDNNMSHAYFKIADKALFYIIISSSQLTEYLPIMHRTLCYILDTWVQSIQSHVDKSDIQASDYMII